MSVIMLRLRVCRYVVVCRHAAWHSGDFPCNSALEASDDVLSDAVEGHPSCLQEVHARCNYVTAGLTLRADVSALCFLIFMLSLLPQSAYYHHSVAAAKWLAVGSKYLAFFSALLMVILNFLYPLTGAQLPNHCFSVRSRPQNIVGCGCLSLILMPLFLPILPPTTSLSCWLVCIIVVCFAQRFCSSSVCHLLWFSCNCTVYCRFQICNSFILSGDLSYVVPGDFHYTVQCTVTSSSFSLVLYVTRPLFFNCNGVSTCFADVAAVYQPITTARFISLLRLLRSVLFILPLSFHTSERLFSSLSIFRLLTELSHLLD